MVAGSVLLALGLAPACTLGTDLVVGAAPPERAGAASALSETGAELGGALGIAVLGSIGAAVYRGRMEDASRPRGSTPAPPRPPRDTLGGAVGAAADLPARLLDAATEAFAVGFQAAATVGAVLMAALAVLAALLLKAGTDT